MIQSVTRKGPALRAGLCLGVCGRLPRLRGGAALALQVGWALSPNAAAVALVLYRVRYSQM